MNHLLFTNYDVGLYDRPDADEWIKHRDKIFMKYCYPSVVAQANKDFTWVMFFDKKTKTGVLDDGKLVRCDNFRCLPVLENTIKLSRNTLIEDYCPVIYTRLDNDDMILPDFIDDIQKAIKSSEPGKTIGVNLSYGYCYDEQSKKMFKVGPEFSNPFISIYMPKYDQSGFAGHLKVMDKMPVIQMPIKRYWVRVIHGKNKINRVSGVPTDKKLEDLCP